MEIKISKKTFRYFRLNYSKIENLEGWGNLSCQNLAKAIDTAKNINLNRFIYSIGIRHIGQENAKILAQYFKTKEKFKDLYNPKKEFKYYLILKT